MKEIRQISAAMEFCSVSWCRGSANKVAHVAAKLVVRDDVDGVWLGDVPAGLKDAYLLEVLDNPSCSSRGSVREA